MTKSKDLWAPERVSCAIPAEQYDRLQEKGWQERKTVSQMVRRAVDFFENPDLLTALRRVDSDLADKFELLAKVRNESADDVIREGLDLWMETAGAAEIYVETGCEIDPTMQHPGAAPATVN